MTEIEFIEKLRAHLPDDAPALIETGRPVDVLLLAELGELVGRRFHALDDPAGMFRLIEEAVVSGDDYLATGVLTGLVEQLQAVADREAGLWHRIAPLLGQRTAYHAAAMNAFFGIDPATSPSS